MSERQDFIALEWVAGEIEETLKQAAQALDAYIANRDDITKLRFCLTHIHQVHGTLQMVEFFGAALLAEEMEGLAHALTQGKVHSSHIDDALNVLQNAINQLPLYLEKVKESRHGLPATLLPVLNDLRAVRGESLLSETVLFSPDMAVAGATSSSPQSTITADELSEVAHKLRQMFQVALLGLIRGNDINKNLNYLAKVCARLVKLTDAYPLQPLWKVCIAVLEGLLNSSIDSSVAVKILLRQVDRQIKQIIDTGEQAFQQTPPDDLLKNLLYYVARSKSNSRYISEVRAEYNLDASLLGEGDLDDDSLATPDSAVMRSVVEALVQELIDIKQALAAAEGSAALANVLPLFKRVNDTMAILGMGAVLKQLQIPYSDLANALATQESVSSEQVDSIAAQITAVEALLNPAEFIGEEKDRSLFNDSEEAQQQLDSAYDSVILESRKALEQAKETIIEFVATQWDHECLSDLPKLLIEISGSLNIVPLPRAARVLVACENYVSKNLLTERTVPEWQMLDTLADAIASIDYYLERLDESAAEEGNNILTVAEESVAELGYPVSVGDQARVESTNVEPPVLEEVQFEEPVENNSEIASEDSAEEIPELSEEVPVLAEVIPFQAPQTQVEPEPEFEQQPELPSEPPVVTVTEEVVDDEDFDPEIVEIFVEEAGEVLAEINESLPKWQADYNDSDAAASVRRAFHTLKGSGRMVNALAIGDLAWSIEEMLNRVLEGTVNIDATRFALIEETRALVPAMVSAFEQRQAIDKTAMDSIIARANQLAVEQSPVFETEALDAAVPEVTETIAENNDSEMEFEADLTETVTDIPVIEDVVDDTATDEEIDHELLEIFGSEASLHVQVLDDFISHCYQLAGPAELTDALQRALHTLKGSANMAGIAPVALVVTPLEHVVKELRASQLKVDEPLLALCERGSLLIKAGIEQLVTTPMKAIPTSEEYIADLLALCDERLALAARAESEEAGIPPEALNNFLTESLDLLTELSGRLVLWQQGDAELGDLSQFAAMMDSLIVQAESVNMIPAVEFGQVAQVLYRQGANADSTVVSDEFFALMNDANDCLVDMLDQIAGHQTPVYNEALFERMQDFAFAEIEPEVDETSDMDLSTPEINAPVLETNEPIETEDFTNTGDMLEELDFVDGITEDNDLFAGADVVELDLDATIGMAAVTDDALASDTTDDIDDFADLEIDIEAVEPEASNFELDTIDSLENADVGEQPPVTEDYENVEASDETVSDIDDIEITAAMTDLADAVAESDDIVHVAEPELELQSVADFTEADEQQEDDEIDAEIVEIFLEEADDLLEDIDEAIHGWGENRSNREHLDDLLRILHTLKGGARLAGITAMGDLSHNFETSLMGLEGSTGEVDDDTLHSLQEYQDQLLAQLTAVKAGEKLADIAPLDEATANEAPAAVAEAAQVEPEQAAELELDTTDDAVSEATDESFDFDDLDLDTVSADLDDAASDPVAGESPVQPEEPPSIIGKAKELQPLETRTLREVSAEQAVSVTPDNTNRKGSQEVVKVSAQLLEELVNLAGETSISRSRAEEQITELVFSLDEMQITVDRLQEQVRRLDMETEQQILYRQEQVESEGLEGFDPLEMDRYSQLQQLSRSLLESSSDLIDIKSTLSDKSRDMETLLVQQSRINTELQEGLMRSQMVPFSRMVPRLRRIVRQVSGELNKRVDFHLDNVEGELDRTVLERMVAPLEHMLRNAVDHGIESAEQREAAGKNSRGNVTLDLAREGGEIVLRLIDDGAGINLEAVKAKAIERGLMEANADLTDHEISQFILQAGFSTASHVTQISGRGVGMDVVHSEIKQLGGTMDIESTPGKGSRFTVRLPFTVSVNRALMVNVGGDRYAIPLNSIEGIVRVSPFELEAYYQPDAPMFEYAGQPYLLRYMGALLHRGEKPNLEGQVMPLPVVLVRGAEHSIAIQVDSLMGSREIVVKPLGPQFSAVQGLSGATVLGDGSVVVILDLLAMIRADASFMHKDLILTQQDALDDERNTLVMVVDDSVTVRKVTSRFLERQGMDVITAKDGMDAVTQLQEIEQVPDLMLLDIEMPRMDGFEVASRVRHNSRLQDIPIIMITSRTGEKHRERAFSLGVNEYMGKPFQETELLEKIELLVGPSVEKR